MLRPCPRPKAPAPKKHRIFFVPVANVHSYCIAKAEKKGRTQAEVDDIIGWLTGYTPKALGKLLKAKTDFKTFFAKAPKLHPKRKLITGTLCGLRMEEIEDPPMRELRCLDKLVDELTKGKAMERVLRG